MINKLISKQEVRLLEFYGNPSQDYKDGYCQAIRDVLDLESIPTFGVDEIDKIRAEIDEKTEIHSDGEFYIKNFDVKRIIDKHLPGTGEIYPGEFED